MILEKDGVLQSEESFTKILDLVGPRHIKDSIHHLSEGGIICSCGHLGSQWTLADFDPLVELAKNVYLTTFYSGNVSNEKLQELIDFVELYQVDVRPAGCAGISAKSSCGGRKYDSGCPEQRRICYYRCGRTQVCSGRRNSGPYSGVDLDLWVEKVSAGESGYGAGEHAFARIAAQRYIRAQKTRSKCRRRFTALHHHTRTPRLRFPTHNSKFRQEGKKTELYRLIRELCSVLLFENRFISCFKNENRINSRL